MTDKSGKELGHAEFQLSVEMMKEIAHEAAKAAATSISHEVRNEMREEAAKLREELLTAVKEEIQSYHGDMTPTEHAIQHARIDKFLGWTEKMSQNFWGSLMSGLIKFAVTMFLLGYFIWHNGADKIVTGGK